MITINIKLGAEQWDLLELPANNNQPRQLVVLWGNLNGGEAWATCRDGHQIPHHVYAFCFTGCPLMDCEIPY